MFCMNYTISTIPVGTCIYLWETICGIVCYSYIMLSVLSTKLPFVLEQFTLLECFYIEYYVHLQIYLIAHGSRIESHLCTYTLLSVLILFVKLYMHICVLSSGLRITFSNWTLCATQQIHPANYIFIIN